MQLFTQPSIADTWVVLLLSSDSQVLVFTAHYRSLCYCNAEFWQLWGSCTTIFGGEMRWRDWVHPCSRTQPFNCCYRGPSTVQTIAQRVHYPRNFRNFILVTHVNRTSLNSNCSKLCIIDPTCVHKVHFFCYAVITQGPIQQHSVKEKGLTNLSTTMEGQRK